MGKPLYLDKEAVERRRVSFACVCIKVNDEIAPLKSIEVEIENMGHISVCIKYPWRPQICSICKGTVHGEDVCKKGQTVWTK